MLSVAELQRTRCEGFGIAKDGTIFLCDPVLTDVFLIFNLQCSHQCCAIRSERLDGVAFNVSPGVVYEARYFYLTVDKAIKLFCDISCFGELRSHRLNRVPVTQLKLTARYTSQ